MSEQESERKYARLKSDLSYEKNQNELHWRQGSLFFGGILWYCSDFSSHGNIINDLKMQFTQ